MTIATFEAIHHCVLYIEETVRNMGLRVDRGTIFCQADGGQLFIFPKTVKRRGYVYTYNGEKVSNEDLSKYKPEELESQRVWIDEEVMYGQYIQGRAGAELVVLYPQLLTRIKEDGGIVLGDGEKEQQPDTNIYKEAAQELDKLAKENKRLTNNPEIL